MLLTSIFCSRGKFPGEGKTANLFFTVYCFLQCASTWGKHPKDRHRCRSGRRSDHAEHRTRHSTPRCRCHSANLKKKYYINVGCLIAKTEKIVRIFFGVPRSVVTCRLYSSESIVLDDFLAKNCTWDISRFLREFCEDPGSQISLFPQGKNTIGHGRRNYKDIKP
jgi:hypothetical protein